MSEKNDRLPQVQAQAGNANMSPKPGAIRIALKPGTPAIVLLATAVEKRIRAGAGRISIKHFVWPDFRMLPALVHPSGKGVSAARRRIRGRTESSY
jgi:hypothetical protein